MMIALRVTTITLIAFCASAQSATWAVPRTTIRPNEARQGGLEKPSALVLVGTNSDVLSLRHFDLSYVSLIETATAVEEAQSGSTVSVPIPMSDVTGLNGAISQINTSIASLTTTVNGFNLPIPMTAITGLPGSLSQINNSIASLTAKVNSFSLPITMSNVTGLNDALNQMNSSISDLRATVNSLNSTLQNLGSLPTIVDFEVPSGTIDGSNTTFTLNMPPSPPSSLALHRNGMKLTPQTDYSLSGVAIVFSSAAVPQPGDSLSAAYRSAANATPAGN